MSVGEFIGVFNLNGKLYGEDGDETFVNCRCGLSFPFLATDTRLVFDQSLCTRRGLNSSTEQGLDYK